ncbi:hypothetical protein BGU98_00060, partial [Clostridioides difficile]
AASIVPIFIVQIFVTLITVVLNNYVIGIPFATFLPELDNRLNGLSGTSQMLLAALLGAMVAVDLVGPVNIEDITTLNDKGLVDSYKISDVD